MLRSDNQVVEFWSRGRLQFPDRPLALAPWQTQLRSNLKAAFGGLSLTDGAVLSGFYDTTDLAKTDAENSLFTNVEPLTPRGVTALRFERGIGAPPAPPRPIDLAHGHLHYYRYEFGSHWTKWDKAETIAQWDRVPRRLPDDGSAAPAWMALRLASAKHRVSVSNPELISDSNFGIRVTVHATKFGPRQATACCEQLIDGVIAACHNDRYSDAVFSALRPKFAKIEEAALLSAIENPVGPIFNSPAIQTKKLQFMPADERCVIGELTIIRDSNFPMWPELSGELYAVRPRG